MFTTTITIEGRLADDPTALGHVAEVIVLANRRGQDEAGEWHNTETTRFTVKTFKHLAKQTLSLTKGEKILVAGSVVTDQWTDKDTGENQYKQIVLADAIGKSL